MCRIHRGLLGTEEYACLAKALTCLGERVPWLPFCFFNESTAPLACSLKQRCILHMLLIALGFLLAPKLACV